MSATTEALTTIPARGMTLWAIDEELQVLMEQAQLEEEEAGAVTPETMQALQVYFQAALTKVDNIAGFLKLEKVLEPAYKAEKQRLEARWSAYRNGFERCKEMMLEFLRARGETKIKGGLNTIARQANSQASLVIEDPAAIPQTYQRMTLTIKTDVWDLMMRRYKDSQESLIELRSFFNALTNVSTQPFVDEPAVRAALQEGLEVAGAELKFGEHIRVR